MPRTILAAAMLALSTPALAAGQHPAASAHPASSAHANAMTAEAEAARIEACDHAANTFLDQWTKGEFKAAVSNFDATLHAGLDAGKLDAVWQSVTAAYGKPESRGAPQSVMYQGMAVVATPLHFEKGDLVAQLACGEDGKFAGFHLRPLAAAPASP